MKETAMMGSKQTKYESPSALEDRPEPRPDDEATIHLSPEGLLPPGHVLAVDQHLGILALLSCENGRPHLKSAQHFTATEMCLLLPLLQLHPAYCPYEVLLAHFTSTRVTEKTIVRARKQLYEAQEAGVWDSVMRSIRNVLSRTRLRLSDLGIGIVSMLEVGYALKPVAKRRTTLG